MKGKRRTCNLSSTADRPAAALVPQTGQLRLQHLQPVQDILDVRQLVVATARLLGDVDAVGEDNLIVPVHRMLHVLGVLHFQRRALVFEVAVAGGVEVHGAEGGGGDVDVVDVVEHHRLVRVWQGEVLLGFRRCQSIPAVADDLFEEAGGGKLEEQGHRHAAKEQAFHPHDKSLTE